jgi:RNA polymerase sigma-70 factor (ECF subfamily)
MAALYPIVHRMVFRLAGVRGRDRQEDLVQSALEQVCRSLETFEGRSRVSTFVFGVCHRVVARANRYERVRRWFRREAEEVCVPLEPRSGATPEAELGRAQRLVAAELALAALDAEERAAFVLHELEEQSLDEVAEALGCSTRTVKRRLRSAREQLLGSGRAEA